MHLVLFGKRLQFGPPLLYRSLGKFAKQIAANYGEVFASMDSEYKYKGSLRRESLFEVSARAKSFRARVSREWLSRVSAGMKFNGNS